MGFITHDILGIVIAASFASGLNVYATVATLGLLSRTHVFALPPSLHLLSSWPVIVMSGLLFLLEFFADKIPAFDLIWNALHTFVRVPVAMLLSFGATQQLSPTAQLEATALAGVIAFAAHSGKIAVRAAVTPSPEPFSNMALSLGEDVAAISLTWFATTHPLFAAAIALAAVLLVVLMLRLVFRSLIRLFHQTRSALRSLFPAV
jgi:uncharacterized protein DUF4126